MTRDNASRKDSVRQICLAKVAMLQLMPRQPVAKTYYITTLPETTSE